MSPGAGELVSLTAQLGETPAPQAQRGGNHMRVPTGALSTTSHVCQGMFGSGNRILSPVIAA